MRLREIAAQPLYQLLDGSTERKSRSELAACGSFHVIFECSIIRARLRTKQRLTPPVDREVPYRPAAYILAVAGRFFVFKHITSAISEVCYWRNPVQLRALLMEPSKKA